MINSSKNWDLRVDPSVAKFLKRIPKTDATKILTVLKSLQNNPYFGDIQKIKDEKDVWRRRVGNFRLFYKLFIDEKIVSVFDLKRRTSKTY